MRTFTKAKVLKAIKDSKGSISVISRRLGCAWHTGDKYVDKWEETRMAKQDELESMCDTAEDVIYEKIEKERDGQYAKWYLGTIGKKRGYVEKHEVDNNINIKDFPDIAEKIRKIVNE